MFLNEFKGLNLQQNSFKNLEGYCEVAENIIISRENIIQKSPGYSIFLETPFATPLALADYKSKIIIIGSNYLRRIDQTVSGDYTSNTALTGQTFTITYPRSTQAAGNLFVTTDNFLLKAESSSATLLKAGIPKAPDLTYLSLGSGTVNDPTAGIHAPDTQIGYRVIYGRKDLNSNTVLGAPSELTQSQNTLYTASAVSLSTFTVTITYTAHGLAVNDFVTIRASNGTIAIPDGEYTVTNVPDANNFKISTTAVLVSAPSGVTALNFGIRRKPKLEFTLPSGVDTTFLYRLYRTDPSISNDVEPDESTLQLIDESNITSTNISNGYIQFTDTIDDLFKTGYLYTNPNTGEGILEANFPPPISRDIALFKNHLFFAYPTTFYSLDLGLIRSSASTFVNNDYIDLLQIDYLKTAIASTWQSGTTVRYSLSSVTFLQVGQYVNFIGFINSANNGKFIITAIGVNYIDCTNAGRTDASLNESSVSANAYPLRRYTAAAANSYNTAVGGNFLLSTSSASISSNIDSTARSICKCINRDTYSNIYASYTSTSQSLVGKMFFYGRIITNSFALQASSSTVGSNFDPTFPTSGTDLTVIGTNSVYPNGLYISKPNEYEAVPLTSFILIGSKDYPIQRIMPLKNSLIILKSDGIFSLRGTGRSNFTVTPLDTTAKINATESVVELNGNLYACTNQGVVSISETSVALVSRNPEPVITAVFVDSNFNDATYANALPDERLYLLTTLKPNSTEYITYSYNVLTDVWTTWTKAFKRGIIKELDKKHYVIDTNDSIRKIRKLNTKLDFCDESSAVSAVSNIATDLYSADIVSPLTLVAGDVIVWNNIINRISSVVGSTVTFYNTINFTIADLPTHYKQIVSTIVFSPTGAAENILRQWSELSIHYRNASCNVIDIGFVSDANEVPNQSWVSGSLAGGWGDLPFGQFEFGLSETTTIDFGSYASEPTRIYIPIECQLSTWLQLKLEHTQAAEQLNIQGLGFVVRDLSNRISR